MFHWDPTLPPMRIVHDLGGRSGTGDVPAAGGRAPAADTRHAPERRSMTHRFLLGLLVACCQAWAWALPHGSQQADLRRLSCDGPLRPDASAATLAEYFGYKNLADADIYVGEGYTEEATVVFGDSPSDRLEVFWKDKAARSGPLRVVVRQTATGFPMSRWHTPAGLTLGMRLRDIERRNGRPFRLSGFGWDYDGTVPVVGGWPIPIRSAVRLPGSCATGRRRGA